MDKLQWIKDLVVAEQKMEEVGEVDFSAGFNPDAHLSEATLEFIKDLKAGFVEVASAFNQMRASSVGTIKIYGISKTAADFMLFRNGYKLIFSVKQPGVIGISLNHVGTFMTQQPSQQQPTNLAMSEELLKATWGAFGELKWTHNDLPINIDHLLRHYLSRFTKDSAK